MHDEQTRQALLNCLRDLKKWSGEFSAKGLLPDAEPPKKEGVSIEIISGKPKEDDSELLDKPEEEKSPLDSIPSPDEIKKKKGDFNPRAY